MVTKTARQKVLAYLGSRNAASAAQIGQALGMSPATVRHHLLILVADGRIVSAGSTTRGKAGRPHKFYRLSDRLLGENIGLLAEVLLAAWLEELKPAKREASLVSLAEKMSEYIGQIDASLPLPKLLPELTNRLNALHYQARWEAGAQGPRVLFGHCPYSAIIARHPELCRMDAAILNGEMKAEVVQLAKIDGTAGGVSHCVFAVRPHPSRKTA